MTEQAETTTNIDHDMVEPGEASVEITPVVISQSAHPIREQDIDREALKVLYRLRDAGFAGYLVGGGVRDLYLGKQPKDFDISTNARPGQLRKLFRNSRTIGRRFRLVQVFFRGNKIIEVSTLRSRSEYDLDADSDTVLPSNNTFGTLQDDAFRRDLTINSLFYEIENHTIIDYVGGVSDLNEGVIRMVGEPDRRFTRDPVRMLRVVRHASRTGFAIHPDTLTAVLHNREKLDLCPPSRIRDEILKDLRSGASIKWADQCHACGLWPVLFPFYAALSAADDRSIVTELRSYLAVLDRLHGLNSEDRPVSIPEYVLLAVLLLPWACRRFHLPEARVKGGAYNELAKRIRFELDAAVGERFNVKRMAKDSITSLLVNLPALHAQRKGQSWPKWLRRKSYFADCRRFLEIFAEGRGEGQVDVALFTGKPEPREQAERYSNERRSRNKGGVNPAFSSRKEGVFGFRKR